MLRSLRLSDRYNLPPTRPKWQQLITVATTIARTVGIGPTARTIMGAMPISRSTVTRAALITVTKTFGGAIDTLTKSANRPHYDLSAFIAAPDWRLRLRGYCLEAGLPVPRMKSCISSSVTKPSLLASIALKMRS